MIEKIEHIGIAVKNLDKANKIYEQLLGTSPYKMETLDSEEVNTSFFKTGESKVELLQATKNESAIAAAGVPDDGASSRFVCVFLCTLLFDVP